MMSPKRFAQLGLGAATFVLVASVAVLVHGAADLPTPIHAGATPPLGTSPVPGSSVAVPSSLARL